MTYPPVWHPNAITGGNVYSVVVEGIRHFFAGQEAIPGITTFCGIVLPDPTVEPGEVDSTCAECGDAACQLKPAPVGDPFVAPPTLPTPDPAPSQDLGAVVGFIKGMAASGADTKLLIPLLEGQIASTGDPTGSLKALLLDLEAM